MWNTHTSPMELAERMSTDTRVPWVTGVGCCSDGVSEARRFVPQESTNTTSVSVTDEWTGR